MQILEALEETLPNVGPRQIFDVLDDLPRGRYEADEVLRELSDRLRVWVTPSQLYYLIGFGEIPRSSIRRELRRLLSLGLVETDGKGGYSLPVLPITLDDLPQNSRLLRKRGFRWWQDKDGTAGIALYDPRKRYSAAPITSRRSVGKGREVGYSQDGKTPLPVLALATSEPYEVVDLDKMPAVIPSSALAVQRTEKGLHLYFRRGEVPPHLVGSDSLYRQFSLERGSWTEKLYNSDGSRRERLYAVSADGEDFAREHNAAMDRAWSILEQKAA